MQLVGLANTRISTDYAQQSPQSLVHGTQPGIEASITDHFIFCAKTDRLRFCANSGEALGGVNFSHVGR
jgi:hypothetical protein